MARYTVLSTKKLHPALIKQAAAKEVAVTEQEFISIRRYPTEALYNRVIPFLDPDERTVVFTSANAVRALEDVFHWGSSSLVPNWKVFCLSGRTKDALSLTIPGAPILDTAENAAALAEKIISSGRKEVIFFCGNKRRQELPELLKKAGIQVQEVIVYETVEVPSLPEGKFDGVMFFSPSAVHSFFSVNQIPAETVCFAIGVTTATAIADYTDNKIITSEGASQEMMMATVLFYFQNINCYE